MRKASILILMTLIYASAIGQFNFNAIYQSEEVNGETSYLRIYSDGVILIADSDESKEEVEKWFSRDNQSADTTKFITAKSNIKNNSRAVFSISENGLKYNYTAIIAGSTLTLTSVGNREKRMLQYSIKQ